MLFLSFLFFMLYQSATSTTIVVINIIVAMVAVTICGVLLIGHPHSSATTNVCLYWYLVISYINTLKLIVRKISKFARYGNYSIHVQVDTKTWNGME